MVHRTSPVCTDIWHCLLIHLQHQWYDNLTPSRSILVVNNFSITTVCTQTGPIRLIKGKLSQHEGRGIRQETSNVHNIYKKCIFFRDWHVQRHRTTNGVLEECPLLIKMWIPKYMYFLQHPDEWCKTSGILTCTRVWEWRMTCVCRMLGSVHLFVPSYKLFSRSMWSS